MSVSAEHWGRYNYSGQIRYARSNPRGYYRAHRMWGMRKWPAFVRTIRFALGIPRPARPVVDFERDAMPMGRFRV